MSERGLLASKQIEPDTGQPAQLVLEEPVVCTYVQRFYCNGIMNSLKRSVNIYQEQYLSEKCMRLENANVSRRIVTLALEKCLIVMDSNKLHTLTARASLGGQVIIV